MPSQEVYWVLSKRDESANTEEAVRVQWPSPEGWRHLVVSFRSPGTGDRFTTDEPQASGSVPLKFERAELVKVLRALLDIRETHMLLDPEPGEWGRANLLNQVDIREFLSELQGTTG